MLNDEVPRPRSLDGLILSIKSVKAGGTAGQSLHSFPWAALSAGAMSIGVLAKRLAWGMIHAGSA
jgi:hypothetical protein